MTTPPLRLFFALPCPAPLAAQICAWSDGLRLDGQPVAQANLHLTLAFLGSVPRGRKAELRAIGERLPRRGFNLKLDHIARWSNGILHLAPSSAPTSRARRGPSSRSSATTIAAPASAIQRAFAFWWSAAACG